MIIVNTMNVDIPTRRFLGTIALGCGWAVAARLLIAFVMIALFVMWYFLLY